MHGAPTISKIILEWAIFPTQTIKFYFGEIWTSPRRNGRVVQNHEKIQYHKKIKQFCTAYTLVKMSQTRPFTIYKQKKNDLDLVWISNEHYFGILVFYTKCAGSAENYYCNVFYQFFIQVLVKLFKKKKQDSTVNSMWCDSCCFSKFHI